MIEKCIEVNSFFEPKLAAQLVQKASQFKSHISIVADEKTANAKSIMGIISLNMQGGNIIKLIVEGEDAQQAAPELEEILRNIAV
ncbi:MAG: HPr family phosphocarrier protein [Defluviitaleaceae bacterium]|nr:HPr family phosphocarrier protein [Defluviitaleaceae bacterium]